MAAAGQGAKNKALELFLKSKNMRRGYSHLIFLIARWVGGIVGIHHNKTNESPLSCLKIQTLEGRLIGELIGWKYVTIAS